MKYFIYKTDGSVETIVQDTPIKYEQISKAVDGSIEAYTTQKGELVYLNEEGRLIGLPVNPFFGEDIRGNVLEFYKVDDEGESIGFSDGTEAKPVVVLPHDMFEKGNKFTVFWISDSWGATVSSEIVTVGRGFNGENLKPVFKLKGKRKEVGWTVRNNEIMIFR